MKPDPQLRKRLITIDIMVPGLVIFSFLGGWSFTLLVTVTLAVAAWELWRMFKKGGYSPSLTIMIAFVAAAVILRKVFDFRFTDVWLASLVLTAMLVHVTAYQKGIATSAVDFALTIGGAVYIGWLGSYAVSIREFPHGLLWVLLVFPIISLADSGAYIFGRLFGRHKMIPLVSPNKSWEGYIGGIIIGALGGWGLAALWHIRAAAVLPIHGVMLGAVISLLAPIGDFGESLIKRQFCVKDSNHILPGHGGILDRADSSLWAAVIGYYLILFILH